MSYSLVTLLELISNPIYITKINNTYQKLLSQLSICPIMSDLDFISKLRHIHKIDAVIYVIFIGNINNDDFKIVASGTILIEPKFIHNSCVGHIEDIVVDSDFRGLGLSNTILNKIKNYAFETKGAYKLILDCDQKLEPFYLKNNFLKKGYQMALYNL
jgi:glucosamine-phosphate N-acetyltransferase